MAPRSVVKARRRLPPSNAAGAGGTAGAGATKHADAAAAEAKQPPAPAGPVPSRSRKQLCADALKGVLLPALLDAVLGYCAYELCAVISDGPHVGVYDLVALLQPSDDAAERDAVPLPPSAAGSDAAAAPVTDTTAAPAAADGTVVVPELLPFRRFRAVTGRAVKTLLTLADGRVVSAGHDDAVKVWDTPNLLAHPTPAAAAGTAGGATGGADAPVGPAPQPEHTIFVPRMLPSAAAAAQRGTAAAARPTPFEFVPPPSDAPAAESAVAARRDHSAVAVTAPAPASRRGGRSGVVVNGLSVVFDGTPGGPRAHTAALRGGVVLACADAEGHLSLLLVPPATAPVSGGAGAIGAVVSSAAIAGGARPAVMTTAGTALARVTAPNPLHNSSAAGAYLALHADEFRSHPHAKAWLKAATADVGLTRSVAVHALCLAEAPGHWQLHAVRATYNAAAEAQRVLPPVLDALQRHGGGWMVDRDAATTQLLPGSEQFGACLPRGVRGTQLVGGVNRTTGLSVTFPVCGRYAALLQPPHPPRPEPAAVAAPGAGDDDGRDVTVKPACEAAVSDNHSVRCGGWHVTPCVLGCAEPVVDTCYLTTAHADGDADADAEEEEEQWTATPDWSGRTNRMVYVAPPPRRRAGATHAHELVWSQAECALFGGGEDDDADADADADRTLRHELFEFGGTLGTTFTAAAWLPGADAVAVVPAPPVRPENKSAPAAAQDRRHAAAAAAAASKAALQAVVVDVFERVVCVTATGQLTVVSRMEKREHLPQPAPAIVAGDANSDPNNPRLPDAFALVRFRLSVQAIGTPVPVHDPADPIAASLRPQRLMGVYDHVVALRSSQAVHFYRITRRRIVPLCVVYLQHAHTLNGPAVAFTFR